MKYTPFQFLIKLEFYVKKKKLPYLNKIKELIMSGFSKNEFENFINSINRTDVPDDSNEDDLELSFEKKDILNDPVRRFFETKLAYRISKKILSDYYFVNNLKSFLNLSFENFSRIQNDSQIRPEVYNNKNQACFYEKGKKLKIKADMLKLAREKNNIKCFSMIHARSNYSKSENDMILKILDFTWHSLFFEFTYRGFKRQILNVYGDGYFSSSYRSKISKNKIYASELLNSPHVSASAKAGILRSSDPVPYFDKIIHPIYPNSINFPIIFNRCPDLYYPDLTEGKNNFPNYIALLNVHPYVNSISGTILAVLRSYIELISETSFIKSGSKIFPEHHLYNNFKNRFGDDRRFFINFFKLITSILLYLEGGHSLVEFYFTLRIDEVQRQLSKLVPHLESISYDYLYRKTNLIEFESVLNETYQYMIVYLNKNKLNNEIKNRF